MNAWLAPGAAAMLAGAAFLGWPAPRPGWQAIAWPFPRDAFPAGLAFRCEGCAGGFDVYIRPKIGFCNCGAGVTDDNEVDGVADLDMIAQDFTPLQPGEAVSIGGMAGRRRSYMLHMPDGTARPGAGLALSLRCDLVVAASQGPGAGSQEAWKAVSDLLETEPVATWIRARLGKS